MREIKEPAVLVDLHSKQDLFVKEFFLSLYTEREERMKMNPKSQPSDGPGHREHRVRVASHNVRKKQFAHLGECFILCVWNLKKVNYFFLVPLGSQEEAIYLIMSRHPAAAKVVIS